jgi:membrane-associated protein
MFSSTHIIESGGLLLIAFMIFAESGMLFGFFFPGDTLLFTAGFFAGIGKLPLLWLMLVVVIAAIAGDNTGYQIGKSLGPKLFKKKDGLIFRQSYVTLAEDFYEKHGGKTILLAQFVPVARTFVPLVAGVSHMPRKKFIVYNIVGVVIWGIGIILLGDWLGSKIPNIDKYLLPIVGLAMLISFGPMVYHLAKNILERKRSEKAKSKAK